MLNVNRVFGGKYSSPGKLLWGIGLKHPLSHAALAWDVGSLLCLPTISTNYICCYPRRLAWTVLFYPSYHTQNYWSGLLSSVAIWHHTDTGMGHSSLATPNSHFWACCQPSHYTMISRAAWKPRGKKSMALLETSLISSSSSPRGKSLNIYTCFVKVEVIRRVPQLTFQCSAKQASKKCWIMEKIPCGRKRPPIRGSEGIILHHPTARPALMLYPDQS